MTHFHAVMLDETGCEFGAPVEAATRDEAYEILAEDYPESRVVQLESPEDTRAREQRIYDSVRREIDGDDWDDDEYDEDEDDEG